MPETADGCARTTSWERSVPSLHADDVVAVVHVNDLPGYAPAQIAEQIHPRAGDLRLPKRPLEWRLVVNIRDHVDQPLHAPRGDCIHRPRRKRVYAYPTHAKIGREIPRARFQSRLRDSHNVV